MRLLLQPIGRRSLAVGLLSAAAFSLAWLQAATVRAADLGGNLIVNGDAEANVGAASNSQVVAPSGWRTTGEFTAVQYGASGGFPDAASPGPDERGKNFFAGGNQPLSTASQTVDLSAYAAAIGSGHVVYDLSAWLGGYESQGDAATVKVTFEDASGKPVGGAILGPVTPLQRRNVTGLLHRETTGPLPRLARSAKVAVTITRVVGAYNDGSVDNLSLTLKQAGGAN